MNGQSSIPQDKWLWISHASISSGQLQLFIYMVLWFILILGRMLLRS